MIYTVTETQYNNDAVTAQAFAFVDKETALEKFFQVAAYIPKSNLNEHTVTINDSLGNVVFPAVYKDIIK